MQIRTVLPLFAMKMFMVLGWAFFAGCMQKESVKYSIQSPDKQIEVVLSNNPKGEIFYRVLFKNQLLLDTSKLGFKFTNGPELKYHLQIISQSTSEFSETWEPVWGTDKKISNHYVEMKSQIQETQAPGRVFYVIFRVFNDGVAFRYEFPSQPDWEEALIAEELSEFSMTGNHTAWWIPGDWDIYEHLYNKTRLSEIDATLKRNHPNLAQTYIPDVHATNTPLTMVTDEGVHLSIHEAALYDYSEMTIHVDTSSFKLSSALVGGPYPYKAKRALPFQTPWRTIQIASDAAGLITSHMIENLNEPCVLENTSWIKPTKYMGIWWEMHIEKSKWDMASKRHGATTQNARKYIDFASKHGIPALLIEGWNTGWENWRGENRDTIFDFVTPYPDFDINSVVAYAKEKNVSIVGHHETSSAVARYEQQMDTAFQFYENLGINAVKTGYVGTILPKGHFHHGQWMVNHYQKVVEKAAEYQIMINAHEPIKPTGIRRTWPNFMSREGMRGQEFNAFSMEGMNYPNHTLIVPFTRSLAGPFDYTPGIFRLVLEPYRPNNRVPHTLAKELSLYILIYSPLQMVADLPEHYEANIAPFRFIEDVAVDWDESRVLNASVGEYLTMVRKEKGKDRWFLGSATNEEARNFEINLDFLTEGKTYTARIYADAPDAHWELNPAALRISERQVKKGDSMDLVLAPGGGVAISFE